MKNFGQNGRNRSWAQRAKAQKMQDRMNGVIDGEKFAPRRYTLAEISTRFEASRLGALLYGELHGEAMLPRDGEIVRETRLIGVVERDAQLSEMIEIDEVFSVSRTDFSSGDLVFVVAQGADLFKLRFR